MARTLLARRETATDNVPALFRLRPLALCDLHRTRSAPGLFARDSVNSFSVRPCVTSSPAHSRCASTAPTRHSPAADPGHHQQGSDAAPKALIVVTGYPYLFESDPNNPILTAFNAATAALNRTIEDAVIATHNDNIVYVDVTKQFEDHGIGGPDETFINRPTPGVSRVEDFHPNAAGYRAYADAISAAIREALDRQKQLA